ncbi:MAG: DUF86 domain-containing protein [Cyanobacteria bacterium J06641_5]
MTSRDPRNSLQDILTAIDLATTFIAGLEFTEFDRDPKTLFATARAIEIIGEAAKNIPQSLRDRYSAIPWREMAGMRDKVSHQYFRVNHRILWNIAL